MLLASHFISPVEVQPSLTPLHPRGFQLLPAAAVPHVHLPRAQEGRTVSIQPAEEAEEEGTVPWAATPLLPEEAILGSTCMQGKQHVLCFSF